MELKCQGCSARDSEIQYLRAMVQDLVRPYKVSEVQFKPISINEKGELVQYGKDNEEKETQETNVLEDLDEVKEVNVVNEIIGY